MKEEIKKGDVKMEKWVNPELISFIGLLLGFFFAGVGLGFLLAFCMDFVFGRYFRRCKNGR